LAVKIVTDSVADIPPKVAEELGISVVPLLLRFGEEVYRDGIEMSNDEFYRRLKNSQKLPVTSVPSPIVFAETYDKLAADTDQILAIMLTSKLSGLYNVALQGIEFMKRKCLVEVIDSQWATMAQGFIVMSAARAANAGATINELKALVQRDITRVDIRAVFDTLEFLRRGGRIGRAQAFLGSTLKIKPAITLRDGVVVPAGKVRTKAKVIDYLHAFAKSYSQIDEIAVEDTASTEEADLLVESLGSVFPKDRIYRSGMTPVIGTHTGPGLLLVAIMGDKR
jgi:DegV family protein with EDD domain